MLLLLLLLQGHCHTSRRFKNCISRVIIFYILRCILLRDVQGFSHAAVNEIGASGCAAVAGALPHLLALQVLNLGGNCFRYFVFSVLQRVVEGFSHAADNEIGDSGCAAVAGALPHLLALQELDLGSNCFRYLCCMNFIKRVTTTTIVNFSLNFRIFPHLLLLQSPPLRLSPPLPSPPP